MTCEKGWNDNWTLDTEPHGTLYGLMGGCNLILNNRVLLGFEADYELRSVVPVLTGTPGLPLKSPFSL